MKLSDCKPGQPVEIQAMTGNSARLNGSQGFLNKPLPDEHGLYAVDFLVKPATKQRDAITKRLLVGESKLKVLADQKPPRNFCWHFRAKSRRYAIQESGEQPQQID